MGDFETTYHTPLPNLISAFPDPDDWQFWDWPLPWEDGGGATGASFQEAVDSVNRHVRIPIHGGGAALHGFPGLSLVAAVNHQPFDHVTNYGYNFTGDYGDSDLYRILEPRASHGSTSGLSEEAVDRHLKTRNHREHHHSWVSDDICAVCHDSMLQEDGEKIATLDCGHDFHAGCIKPWLLRCNRCPLCRATGIRLH